jgi:hypothetical protein
MWRKGNVEQAIRMPLSRLATRQGLPDEIIASIVAVRRGKLAPLPQDL